MSRKVTSFRLSELAARQLGELTTTFKMNNSEVISHAIDRMYRQEFGNGINPMKQETQTMTSYSFLDLQSVLCRIPAANPFYPYRGDTVVVIKNEDGSISVMDNGEETEFTSVVEATSYIDQLRPVPLDLSSVDEYA